MHGKRECCLIILLGNEKVHRNNFRVSLPRCRAVRVRIEVCSFADLGDIRLFEGTTVRGERSWVGGRASSFYALPSCLTAPLMGIFVITMGGQRLESDKG